MPQSPKLQCIPIFRLECESEEEDISRDDERTDVIDNKMSSHLAAALVKRIAA